MEWKDRYTGFVMCIVFIVLAIISIINAYKMIKGPKKDSYIIINFVKTSMPNSDTHFNGWILLLSAIFILIIMSALFIYGLTN